MKRQIVSVDFSNMVYTACSYLALAGAVWILLRLIQACFWLPRHLKKQNDVQRMLQDKIDDYEKYIMDCEEKEKNTSTDGNEKEDITQSAKWKERRECLDMLKRELNRVREGGNINDWDHLLEEEEKKILEEAKLLENETKQREIEDNDAACQSQEEDFILQTKDKKTSQLKKIN